MLGIQDSFLWFHALGHMVTQGMSNSLMQTQVVWPAKSVWQLLGTTAISLTLIMLRVDS